MTDRVPTCRLSVETLNATQAWQERAEWTVVLDGTTITSERRAWAEKRVVVLSKRLDELTGGALPADLVRRIEPTMQEWRSNK